MKTNQGADHTYSKRWLFVIPALAAGLGIFYLTKLSLFIFWHPILTVLIKIIYFPFFIVPEKTDIFVVHCGFMPCPNLITIGIGLLLSFDLLYLIPRLTADCLARFHKQNPALWANVITFLILIIPSIFLANLQMERCISEKSNSPAGRIQASNYDLTFYKQGIVRFYIRGVSENEFKEMNKKLGLFYFINRMKYERERIFAHIITVSTKPGEEVPTACRLEFNPNINVDWPVWRQ